MIKIGKVEMYMGPKNIDDTLDDLEEVIVKFINGAKKRLDIAVQELENRAIAEAIIDARKRKVTVKVVLEADYLSVLRITKDPWDTEKGSNKENREIHDALLRANIWVRSDFNTGIFHQKFIVRDRSAILTGSTNFTDTGVKNNLNHIVIIRDKKIADIYAREFREISRGKFGKHNEGRDEVPLQKTISGIPIKVLFAPDHNPEMEIMKQMSKGKSTIDFAIFTFSQSSGIDDVMIALSNGGLAIQGALDAMQGNQEWAATRPVRNAGASLHLIRKSDELNKLHHKLMVIDGQVVIAGSFNYTGPANRINDENIMVLGDLETTNVASIEKQKQLAGFAQNEINRIISIHGKQLV